MAPSRSFRVSFRVATGRRAAGYELRDTGHWPLAREKVVGIPSLPFEGGLQKSILLCLLGVYGTIATSAERRPGRLGGVRVVIIKPPNMYTR